jgi:hypothetical protein
VVKKERLFSHSSNPGLPESSSDGSVERLIKRVGEKQLKPKPRKRSGVGRTTAKRSCVSRNSCDLGCASANLREVLDRHGGLRVGGAVTAPTFTSTMKTRTQKFDASKPSRSVQPQTYDQKIADAEGRLAQMPDDRRLRVRPSTKSSTKVVSRGSKLQSALHGHDRKPSLTPAQRTLLHVKRIYSPSK